VLDDFTNAAHFGGAGYGVGVDDAETEVGLEEGVHHNAVTELEYLEREDCAWEQN